MKYMWKPDLAPSWFLTFGSFNDFRDLGIPSVFGWYQERAAVIQNHKTCFKSKLMCYKIVLQPSKPYSASWKEYFDVSKDHHIWIHPLQLRGLSARRVPPGLCSIRFMLPEVALPRRSELVGASKTHKDCTCVFLNHLRWSNCLQHSA